MPTFDFIKKTTSIKSFRVASVMGKFDLKSNDVQERFTGSIDIPNKWNVGLIVGKSGSGKTSIAKQLFDDLFIDEYKYNDESVIDNMPLDCSVEDITRAFSSVGFSSPPSWLKSYNVLSNGEKMRVDLARCILLKKENVLFDEFTSVVDRQVAKICSFALQKAIRRIDKKFIAVTCHYDVEQWLLPDWIFNTDTMTFHLNNEKQKKNRPEIKFEIFETKRKSEYWRMFSKFHYLSHVHNNAARVFICTIDNSIAGFISVIHFPHPSVNNMKKIHRLVVLPDYQGIGIGGIFLNKISEIIINENNRVSITTSAPQLIFQLKKSPQWRCTHIGRNAPHGGLNGKGHKGSSDRLSVSYEYIKA